MASSNRHWPSLFKSKPCYAHQQWQYHDINTSSLLSGGFKSPYTSGCEERSPEPKPRWNPKPEQIQILEAIFNSGMVNPSRDEIRRIRAQLQEYGHVGDANVFYWFQNRKSRSKNKHRHLQSTTRAQSRPTATSSSSSSPSSSSDRSSGADKPPASNLPMDVMTMTSQMCYDGSVDYSSESFYSQGSTNGYGFALAEVMGQEWCKSGDQDEMKAKQMEVHHGYDAVACAATIDHAIASSVTGQFNEIQGLLNSGNMASYTVFINELAFDVVARTLNLREVFGEEAILLHSSGYPVVTDEFGVTIQPLQHGASYYLV
ncbi:WUSCHEL-related homeobox 9-like isoform X1 [Typha latifolia]|uniref:WUSCHEL-related homeobox 9-like isoform X1 n=1 Tax=Typha latifolia TaxID=4733 RepID=UPI003C2E44A9